MKTPTLTLIRGIAGSGKSTLGRELASHRGSTLFEADQYFVDSDGNYNFDKSKLREAHLFCQNKTKEYLCMGWDVIVANTFCTEAEMAPYFDIGREFSVFPSVIYCQNDFGSIHGVPEETLSNMVRRFKHDLTAYMVTKKLEFFCKETP